MHVPVPAPDSDVVTSALEGVDPEICWLVADPIFGERLGTLIVVSRPVGADDVARAFVALWKAWACIVHELPYTPWDAKDVELVRGLYKDSLDRSVPPKSTEGFLSWIRGRGLETLHPDLRPHEELRPRPRLCQPDAETVAAHGLDRLDFMHEAALVWPLDDAWNGIRGLFCWADRWFFASWDTSA